MKLKPNRIPETRVLYAYRADEFRAICGVNDGHGIRTNKDLVAGDLYSLKPGALPVHLTVTHDELSPAILEQSVVEFCNRSLRADCRITLMDDHAQMLDALILADVEAIAETEFLFSFAQLEPQREYTLITSTAFGGLEEQT